MKGHCQDLVAHRRAQAFREDCEACVASRDWFWAKQDGAVVRAATLTGLPAQSKICQSG